MWRLSVKPSLKLRIVSDVREAAEEEGRLGGFQQVKTIFEVSD